MTSRCHHDCCSRSRIKLQLTLLQCQQIPHYIQCYCAIPFIQVRAILLAWPNKPQHEACETFGNISCSWPGSRSSTSLSCMLPLDSLCMAESFCMLVDRSSSLETMSRTGSPASSANCYRPLRIIILAVTNYLVQCLICNTIVPDKNVNII